LIGAVRTAASAAGRNPEAVDAAAYLLCAVSSDRAEARDAMRRDPFVVYQFAVIDEAVLRESGVDPQVKRRIAEPFWKGDLTAATREVSDALLDEFTLAGTASDLIARLDAYVEAGVRLPILQPIATAEVEVRRVIDVGREFARNGALAG